MQSSPLPSSPPFMSGVCSSTFQSTLPRAGQRQRTGREAGTLQSGHETPAKADARRGIKKRAGRFAPLFRVLPLLSL
ncbi:hypothetical protein [Treponema endosymbiont of Eucomonympha sp.]|uniref:hypothetical protein n=1 Tax=Treponema endosymbiont of Eucomonympha sp. TaxID=1580831 RepID=UPI0013968717|nr:hypothetical protein [Treponema endosymbiont of Eucomonympha sp.]